VRALGGGADGAVAAWANDFSAGANHLSGSAENFSLHRGLQNQYVVPACACDPPLAAPGVTIMPHTGSLTLATGGESPAADDPPAPCSPCSMRRTMIHAKGSGQSSVLHDSSAHCPFPFCNSRLSCAPPTRLAVFRPGFCASNRPATGKLWNRGCDEGFNQGTRITRAHPLRPSEPKKRAKRG